MGYGKFCLCTPINHESSSELHPAITSRKSKQSLIPVQKTPINRIRHGVHPHRKTSEHVNYKDLNKGQQPKSLSKSRKRPCPAPLTLSEPSESRLAAQHRIKEQKLSKSTKSTNIKASNTPCSVAVPTATVSSVSTAVSEGYIPERMETLPDIATSVSNIPTTQPVIGTVVKIETTKEERLAKEREMLKIVWAYTHRKHQVW